MRRRIFISTSTAAGLALSGARRANPAAIEIPKRVLGKTGEKVTIIGQAGGRFPIEDDVRFAQQFNRAKRLAGPRLENWKRENNQKASASHYRDGAVG